LAFINKKQGIIFSCPQLARAGSKFLAVSAMWRLYFFDEQVQSLAGLLQPEQTLFFIGRPHFLHGVHPHAWHIVKPPKT